MQPFFVFPTTCKKCILVIVEDLTLGIIAKAETSGGHISLILVRCIIITVNTTQYYTFIDHTMISGSVRCKNTPEIFKIEHKVYINFRDQDKPNFPKSTIETMILR